jgi:UDP-glucose 4-epimerase
MTSWVIGSNGLLGSAVSDELKKSSLSWQPTKKIIWDNAGSGDTAIKLEETIEAAVKEYVAALGTNTWEIYWCAGVGVVGSDMDVLDREVTAMKILLSCMRSSGLTANKSGRIFFASSAGGVYAGSSNPPFTEETAPIPISDYGAQKLQIEELLINFGKSNNVETRIGRIANIYGANQNIRKQQGIVTALVKSTILNTTVSMYVPLNTLRNYIFVSDAAFKIVNFVRSSTNNHDLRNICSNENWSLGSLIRITKDVTKKRILLAQALNNKSILQPLDLRMKSLSDDNVSSVREVSLPVGVSMVREHLLKTHQVGNLRLIHERQT